MEITMHGWNIDCFYILDSFLEVRLSEIVRTFFVQPTAHLRQQLEASTGRSTPRVALDQT